MSARQRRERAAKKLVKKLHRVEAVDVGEMSAQFMEDFGGPRGMARFIGTLARDAPEGSIAQVNCLRFILDVCKPQFENDQEILSDTDTEDLEALLVHLVMDQAEEDDDESSDDGNSGPSEDG